MLSFLTLPDRENRYLQVLRNTVAPLVPRPFRTRNFFSIFIIIWQGGNSLPKHFERNPKSLESLNFLAFTKPNKYKKKWKGFSTTWPNLFSNTRILGEF